MGMVRMVARKIGLGGLQSVNEVGTHEKVEMSIDSQRRDLPFLPLLQQCNEFVSGKRLAVSEHFRVDA